MDYFRIIKDLGEVLMGRKHCEPLLGSIIFAAVCWISSANAFLKHVAPQNLRSFRKGHLLPKQKEEQILLEMVSGD